MLDVGIWDEEDSTETPQVNFRCPRDLYVRLERLKDKVGKSRSEVIVRILRYAIDEAEAEAEKRSPKK